GTSREFDWALAPVGECSECRVGVVHCVCAVGNAAAEHEEATLEVLRWLGSAEGQVPLGATGAAFPAAVDSQSSFTDYWENQGVDTSEFIAAAERETAAAPLGPHAHAGANAMAPYLEQMFAGT